MENCLLSLGSNPMDSNQGLEELRVIQAEMVRLPDNVIKFRYNSVGIDSTYFYTILQSFSYQRQGASGGVQCKKPQK